MESLLFGLVSFALLMLVVLIHEMGHFLAHRLLGVPIKALWIGLPFGRLRVSFRLGSYSVFVTPLFFLGAGVDVDEDDWWGASLLSRSLCALYGPAANFLTVLLAFALLPPQFGGLNTGAAFIWAGIASPWMLPSMIATGGVSVADVSGPLGLARTMASTLAVDPVAGSLFWFLLLSVSLGGINLFPLPALDGGQVVVGGLVAIGLPIPWAQRVTKISFVTLLTLMLVVTVKDFFFVFLTFV